MKRHVCAGLLVVLLASTALCQNTQTSLNQQPPRPLNLLVLGDSISWGQGLKTENKSWYHVKAWLEKSTGRPVIERIEAHSGAVIERASATDSLTATNPEVNVGLPTVNDELDSALRFYSDGSKVDVVLISGCGNDVGLLNLLNASGREEVDRMTEAKCGAPVERLLHKVLTSFPIAKVVIIGYYPFFSEKTRNDFVLNALVKRFLKTNPGVPKMNRKEVLERLTANSQAWYQASNKTLAEAVRKVNVGFGAGRQRLGFVKIDFPPEYSFAAKETRLWGFDRSPFRMMLVFLSFGRIMLPPNDEVRSQRKASCDEVFRRQPNETTEQKKERKSLSLLCRYAALGHPNRKGALLYAAAITDALNTNLEIEESSKSVRLRQR
jgi:lysophospholipase L1-like esterase